ncbi:hypothetical protein TIFTF001_030252 [Ficus carica]|uniref:Uncharacterized protein n=1 Tax=Ficus carica TaxID=3494 RepID=A0AA88DSV5_FICCA|nr:hypothetical protein TIFTF001_030252 [Ficus carica]
MLFIRSTKHCEGHDHLCFRASATLAWTVAKDCYPGEARSIRKEEWEVLIIVTLHARGRSSSGFQGVKRKAYNLHCLTFAAVCVLHYLPRSIPLKEALPPENAGFD